MVIGQPVGDAVVPGGAAQSPDLETLKKYLLLREQDVAALSAQLRSARERVSSVEDVLRLERGRGVELTHVVEEQKKRIDDFEREKAIALEAVQGELAELKFEVKAKTDKTRVLELQVREATEEMERLRERVRLDIRKIRVREKELENRLEIMKKDSEALIGARENKIIELKRKLDLLEFNMDLLQDQYTREKENAARLRERLAKAAQVVRVAEGLLDQPGAAGAKAGAAGTEDAESKDKGERAAS
jgi:chromosome segregation ATPase